RAPASGNYTALVGASSPRTAGSYEFVWQLLDQPAATPLECGQTTTSVLSADAQFRYYSVSANNGDLLKLVLSRLPGTINAQLELFDSTGTLLATNANEIARKVTPGNYLVLVG